MDELLTDKIRGRWKSIIIFNETPQEVLSYAKDIIFQLCDALDACRREREALTGLLRGMEKVADTWSDKAVKCEKEAATALLALEKATFPNDNQFESAEYYLQQAAEEIAEGGAK
jgi:hypothetical protein